MSRSALPAHNPQQSQVRKIVFVTNGNPLGGAEIQLLRLAAGLRREGFETAVIALLPNPELARRLAAEGIQLYIVRMIRPFRGPSAIFSGLAFLRAQRPDVVICFDYQSIMLGRVAGALAGVPVIISSIRNERFGGRGRELAVRITDRLGVVTVTNSALVATAMKRRGIVPERRMITIGNGVEPSFFAQSVLKREALGIGADDFVWLAAGRLEKQKDFPNLLRAFRLVLGRCATARLLIAGEGSLRGELQVLATKLGLGNAVTFAGHRDDLPALMGLADALVLSSAWEGLPNVVIEAQVAGLPVVATDVGGLPELVADGLSGYLVSPRNSEALAEAMLRLSALNKGQRRAMGQTGKRDALSAFSLPTVVQSWMSLIDAHAGAARPPRSA